MARQSIFSDNFDRPNESLYVSANWEQHKTDVTDNWIVDTNRARLSTSGVDTAQVAGFTFANDQYAEATVAMSSGIPEIGPAVRCSAPSTSNRNFYAAQIMSGGDLQLQKWINDSRTRIVTFAGVVVDGDVVRLEIIGTTLTAYVNNVSVGSETVTELSSGVAGLTGYSSGNVSFLDFDSGNISTGPAPFRKSSTFDIETTLGTITTATLNGVNVFDHVTGQVGTTVSFAGAATDEITTSGEYSLVLGDGTVTETITLQVNVVGVAPSNNPVQKDGAALASLTGVQLRVTNGANINGTELYYSGTATTDASGNLSNIDLSSTAAADADPVLLHMRTSAGDNIIASETVGLI